MEVVIVNTIAPIAYAERAREIAAACLNSSPDVNVSAADMLPVQLRPIGSVEPSHVWCSRRCHTHGLRQQLDFFSAINEPWVCGEAQTVENQASLILSRYGAVVGDAATVLEYLALEVC